MDQFDIPMLNDAIAAASFPKEVTEWIWEEKREPFSIKGNTPF